MNNKIRANAIPPVAPSLQLVAFKISNW